MAHKIGSSGSFDMVEESYGRKGSRSGTNYCASAPQHQPLCKYQYQPQCSHVFQVAPVVSATTAAVVVNSYQIARFYGGGLQRAN